MASTVVSELAMTRAHALVIKPGRAPDAGYRRGGQKAPQPSRGPCTAGASLKMRSAAAEELPFSRQLLDLGFELDRAGLSSSYPRVRFVQGFLSLLAGDPIS